MTHDRRRREINCSKVGYGTGSAEGKSAAMPEWGSFANSSKGENAKQKQRGACQIPSKAVFVMGNRNY
jgi:hypothetical protein